ncbi:hypothetical protein ACFLV5_04370 [Chloroflexota bacterium]
MSLKCTFFTAYRLNTGVKWSLMNGLLLYKGTHFSPAYLIWNQELWCKTEVGGVARYENDRYQQISQDIANIPGNPWFICTMWVAQYHIARAQSIDDLKPVLQILT